MRITLTSPRAATLTVMPAKAGLPARNIGVTGTGAKTGWVYMTTNRPGGVLYIGVTADLLRRASEHQAGKDCGFYPAIRAEAAGVF